MRRMATATIVLGLLAGACEPSPGGSEPARSPAAEGAEPRHVVLDTDLAFDDIMALLYLLQRDDVAIDAVTIAGTGEAHCEPGVRNALGLLALGGETDTPVACGRETPLKGTNAFPDEWRSAVDDLSMLDLPAVDRRGDPRGAVRLLLDTLDGDATLITLGPLTNVAEALRADPGFASRVPELVAMAGAIDTGGNTPNGVAEYNVWVDPLAAKEVIEGMDATLVPLDATDDVPFTPFFADALAAHLASPEAEAVDAIIAANQEIFLQGGYSFWDTLATALVFRPELATWDEARVVVTASEDAGAGWIDRWEQGSPVRFATTVPDPLAFEREYLSVLTGEPVTDVRPEPTVTVSFDGSRCSIRPRRLSAGEQVVAYEDERGRADGGAILLQLSDAFTYEDLRHLIGPDGSILPRRTRPPKGIEVLTFVDPLAEATTIPSVVAGLCASGGVDGGPGRVWLTPPVEVAP
ncbi:MAG TPA: nucleoside hydrolase [Actinomycetota bacterium]|nr:nucleoside hydrolase [Actinomycetota bacterium]